MGSPSMHWSKSSTVAPMQRSSCSVKWSFARSISCSSSTSKSSLSSSKSSGETSVRSSSRIPPSSSNPSYACNTPSSLSCQTSALFSAGRSANTERRLEDERERNSALFTDSSSSCTDSSASCEGGWVAHVLQNVGDTNLLVLVRGQFRDSAFEEPRAPLGDRNVWQAPHSDPPG